MKLSTIIKILSIAGTIGGLWYSLQTYGIYKKEKVSSLEKATIDCASFKEAILDTVSKNKNFLKLKDSLIIKLQLQVRDFRAENLKLKSNELSAVEYVKHLEKNGMIDTAFVYVEVKRARLIGPKEYIVIDPKKVINPIKR